MVADPAFAAVNEIMARIGKKLASDAEIAEFQAEQERLRRDQTWRSLRQPPCFHDTVKDSLPTNLGVLSRVLRWQYNPKGLLLVGPTGSGKTRSLSLLAHRLVTVDGKGLAAWACGDFADAVRTAHKMDGLDSISYLVARLSNVSVLWLDDLGKSRFHEDEALALFSILDFRLAAGKPVWITTELSSAELSARLRRWPGAAADAAASVLRRIAEACEVVEVRKQDGL